jgi:hypothetical protein
MPALALDQDQRRARRSMPAPAKKAVEQSQAQAREPMSFVTMSFVTSVSGTVIISGKTGPASAGADDLPLV